MSSRDISVVASQMDLPHKGSAMREERPCHDQPVGRWSFVNNLLKCISINHNVCLILLVMTSSKMETAPALLALCEGDPRSPVDSPHKGQWRGALIFFYLRLNKRFSKQSRRRQFETPSRSFWRHCNVIFVHEGRIDNESELIEVLAWYREGDNPSTEPNTTWFTDAYMRHQGPF